MQLLKDGVITPYAGGLVPICSGYWNESDRGWTDSGGPGAASLPAGPATGRLPVMQPCAQASGLPSAVPPRVCGGAHSQQLLQRGSEAAPGIQPPSCPLAGRRFPLDQVKEAVAVATSAARGGKALLEG